MVYNINLVLRENTDGYIVSIDGLEYTPCTFYKALSIMRGIWLRFGRKYKISLENKCLFYLNRGELDYIEGKCSFIVNA